MTKLSSTVLFRFQISPIEESRPLGSSVFAALADQKSRPQRIQRLQICHRQRFENETFQGGNQLKMFFVAEKLLAIAKKNAVKLLSSDNLMGMDHAKLVAIKSGGQSLSQLTSFCR